MAYVKRPIVWEGYQQALGCYTTSKRDFLNKMKAMGCEFADKVKVGNTEPKPYERSKWAADMHSTVILSKTGKKAWKPGDRFMDQLKKRKITKEKFQEAQQMAKNKKFDKNGGFA